MKEFKVLVFNINKQKIELYNVFNHYHFNRQVEILLNLKENLTREEFSKMLREQAMYYFWSKAEWEVLVTPWCGCRDTEKSTIKIDVYDQLIANWEVFIDYVLGEDNNE